ncbi:MAG: alpha/beta hydrolase [Lachnospiraceae bacterium]|nr:alpha/beta hydrolase [Lachnospiraceae bacterium]
MSEIDNIVKEIRDAGIGNKVDEKLLEKYSVRKSDEKDVPTRDGVTHIYIYTPVIQKNKYPLFLNIHGGGFVKGHREQDVVFSRNVCSNAESVVIDIDYTPAPEQKFPYALHQCYDVLVWAMENADNLKIDTENVIICGHSAGGNLATGVCLLAQKSENIRIRLQILDYPALDLFTPPEFKRNAYATERLFPEKCRLYNDLYIDEANRLNPLASPSFAPEEMLKGMPEAIVITCGDDILGEEGEKYAYKLVQSGVTVTSKRFLNSSHGFVVQRKGDYVEAEKIIFSKIKNIAN